MHRQVDQGVDQDRQVDESTVPNGNDIAATKYNLRDT